MALREWAERALKVVEQDGTACKSVRLANDGGTWMTWEPPFPDVETFLTEANAVLESVKAESSIKRIPVMFTAESGSGATLSQYPTSVTGTNKNADAMAGAGNNAAKAFAEGMEGLTRVMVAVLASAEKQVVSVTKTLESQANQIHELIEYHRIKQELEMLEKKEDSDASTLVMAQLKELLPQIPAALDIFLAGRKQSLAAELVKSAATAVTKTTNGAATP